MRPRDFTGDYYICDLATDLTHDRRRIVSRLKKVRFLSGPIVVERAATFTDYREFATRFIHYFQIQDLQRAPQGGGHDQQS